MSNTTVYTHHCLICEQKFHTNLVVSPAFTQHQNIHKVNFDIDADPYGYLDNIELISD